MADQIYYKAEASVQKIRNYILDICSLSIIIFAAINFKSNPILISIIIIFFSFAIIISGHNKIVIYENSIEFSIQHPINIFTKKWIFEFKDIESLDFDLRLTEKGFIFYEVFSSFLPGSSLWNTISVKLKDNTEKIINTKVYKEDLIRAIKVIKSINKTNMAITGI